MIAAASSSVSFVPRAMTCSSAVFRAAALRPAQSPFGVRAASTIKFLGKDRWSGHHELGPHPEAPQEFKQNFKEFHEKTMSEWTPPPQAAQSSASSSSGLDWWELPPRFIRKELDEPEMAAIESGGAYLDMTA